MEFECVDSDVDENENNVRKRRTKPDQPNNIKNTLSTETKIEKKIRDEHDGKKENS